MSWPLFRKILRDLRWPLFWIGLLLAVYEALWAKITDRITIELIPAMTKLAPLKAIAEILFKGSGKLMQTVMGGEMIKLDDPMDMLTIGYVHPVIQTIFSIWAVGRASAALAGEIDRGTMELLLAQPIARWKVVSTHFLVDLVTIPVLCLCLILGTWVGVSVVGLPDIEVGAFWRALLNAGALMFAISGCTMALSAMGRRRGKVLSLALGIALVAFIFNVLAQLWDALAPYRALSLYYYYQPQPLILQNRPDPWQIPIGMGLPLLPEGEALFHVNMVAALVVVGLAGYAVALWQFTRRDLPAPL